MAYTQKESGPLWVYPKHDPELKKTIIDEFKIHPVIAQILVSRGFNELEDIHNYLYAKLPALFSPYLFADMDKAVTRIMQALKKSEKILIYGDNDVDGMTAAALLTEFLKKLGAKVYFYVPNRNELRKNILGDALQIAIKQGSSLLITVDCGITAAKEVEKVIEQNVDVIITDHHEPTSKIPNCIATLNPKLINSTYPNRELTGVGVAFKLAHALTDYLSENEPAIASKIDLKDYLDLVALGTIADMGALLGENRILVRYGLKTLKKTKRIGLIKLFGVSELNINTLSPMEIASKVAPRLNSLGRIADPNKGVELLLSKDDKTAENLAKELDLYNIERQKIERHASEEIEAYIKDNPKILNDRALVLHSENWHSGIIAIITARIAKLYNRPTLIIAIEQGVGKGSIRTIPEFPLLPILKENEEFLLNYGGHDYAAGLTIQQEKILPFKKKFIESANARLKDQDVTSKLYLDARIEFSELTFDFMESLNLLEPYGNENPPPILFTDSKQTWPPKVVGKAHLKMFLEQGDRMLEGIGFGLADRKMSLRKMNISMRVAFTPHINSFLNKSSIQLMIKDFKVKED
jgi:single-stranded-DNA-specific exonuclease